MKTDLYTKIVLTIIAIALSAIAFQNVNFVSTATASTASTAPNPLPAPTQNNVIDVRLVDVGGEIGTRSYRTQVPVVIVENKDK
ncbi:hypothetical protein CLV62_101487 [Dysgonomonas alginatilytica]|uniref:Uncharacterized protein n=1 Tax=Dysgonomonas alginatilytica TaxID=1605892 RepID=A0A2V3PX96_9BACT|nr:hypothetical protein [Dysgonomonas alginatilytica]PXV69218.1 hypothetical protein CLV62_101487 [Dysgonomonas alginatilytica]